MVVKNNPHQAHRPKGVLNPTCAIVSLLADLDDTGGGQLIVRGQGKQAFRNASHFEPWIRREYVINWYAETRVPRSKLAENWGVIIDKDQLLIRHSNAWLATEP
jgi:hypothetical protein